MDDFLPPLPSTPNKFGGLPIHVPSLPISPSEQEKVSDSFSARLSAYVRYLAGEVNGHLDNFQEELKKNGLNETKFFEKTDALLRKEVLQGYSNLIDHRYFFIAEGFGCSVCGVATQCLMDKLRDFYKKQAAHFLSKAWITACREAPNHSVKGFIAEQIVISALQNQGVVLYPTEEDALYFHPTETENF